MQQQSNQATENQANHSKGDGPSNRSITENIRELTESSKQLLDAGKQMTDNLGELSRRVEHARDVSSRVFKSPWMIAGAAIAAGTLVIAFSGRKAA